MQERLSKLCGCRPGETGLVIELGTVLSGNDAAMGIIKVVSVSSFPGQVKDPSQVQKTYQVSLLSWGFKRRVQHSAGVSDNPDFSSTE